MSNHNIEEHNDENSNPNLGSFEVPILLGGLFWGLVIMIINVFSPVGLKKEKCCNDETKCEKTEIHAEH